MQTQVKQIGPYRLQTKVGESPLYVEYLAVDTASGKTFSVRTPGADYPRTPAALTRFVHGGRRAIQLRHEHILSVIDAGEADGEYYIATEYRPGERLTDLLASATHPLADRQVAGIVAAVAAALDYAHSLGIIHEGLTSDNILVAEDGTVLVSDFCLAEGLDTSKQTSPTAEPVFATYFLAPEQVRPDVPSDYRADIYSLGVAAYAMVTRNLPFAAQTQSELLSQIMNDTPRPPETLNFALSSGVAYVLRNVLAKEPDVRYGAAGEFHDALVAGMAWNSAGGTAARPGVAQATSQRTGRRGLAGVLLALLALLLIAGGALFVLQPGFFNDPTAGAGSEQVANAGSVDPAGAPMRETTEPNSESITESTVAATAMIGQEAVIPQSTPTDAAATEAAPVASGAAITVTASMTTAAMTANAASVNVTPTGVTPDDVSPTDVTPTDVTPTPTSPATATVRPTSTATQVAAAVTESAESDVESDSNNGAVERVTTARMPTATPDDEASRPSAAGEAVALAQQTAPTATNTAIPPTATNAPRPTATNTAVPPTATNTPRPTATNTAVPPTATNTPRPTATNTAVPPTATNTPRPTATNTAVPPTATNTPRPTATNTAVPPTATNTPRPLPTATNTPLPPTATNTPEPLPTATPTALPPTATAIPPTATNTAIPPTSTPTAVPAGSDVVQLLAPSSGSSGTGDQVFEWNAGITPGPGQAFELVFWQDGQDPLARGFGLAAPTSNNRISVNLSALDNSGSHPLEPGQYKWGLLLVQTEPTYQRLGFLGVENDFRFYRAGGSSGGDSGGPPSTGE